MNTCDQLQSSLHTEFKRKARSRLRFLWTDLMELEAAPNESALLVTRGQVLRRLRALSLAADAANAPEVQPSIDALSLLVAATTRVRDETNYECFDALYKRMRDLADTLHAVKAPSPLSGRESHPVETMCAEFSAN